MKKLSLMSMTILGFATLTAQANTVAVWNSQVAITNSNYAKAKIVATQNTVKPKQQQLQSYKANIERLQQQYDTQKDKLTDPQKQALAKQIQSNLQSYEQVAGQIQAILSASETDVLQKVAPKIQAITETLIKQKNIDILLDSRDRNVTFVKPEWDLTNEITQKINEQVR